MSGEFIKIKNDTGDGEMLLKVAMVLRVADRDGGAWIDYGSDLGKAHRIKTTSTAAEVLEAVRRVVFVERPATKPLVTIAPDGGLMAAICAGHVLGDILESQTGERWDITVQTVKLPTSERGFRFNCSWRTFQKSTNNYGGQYLSDMNDGETDEWARKIAEHMAEDAMKSQPLVLGFDRAKEGSDENVVGYWQDGNFSLEPGFTPEGKLYEMSIVPGDEKPWPYGEDDSCLCTNFAGQHRKCPKHGEGTAWRDLRGE